jgi:glycosyltransferase involved in cell wall biosynthesis
MSPKVTVLMPVYNGEPYLAEAINSILAQTFRDFEFLIIDDGSRDDSVSVIGRFADPRIRFYRQENAGLAATLNRGIGMAAGEYVARQDQDDLSLPLRLDKQVGFLDANPGCALVGTRDEIWAGDRKTSRVHPHPAENYILKFNLLFDTPFVHSSVMLRKSALAKVGAYTTDPSRQPPEDYELWSRIAREFDVANIPEPLHVYREIPGSMTRGGVNPFRDKIIRISGENLAWYLGGKEPDADMLDLARLVHGDVAGVSSHPSFERMEKKLFQIIAQLASDPHEAGVLRGKALERVKSAKSAYRRRGRFWDCLRLAKRHLLFFKEKPLL